jgi:hypothetical protein
MDIKRDGQLSQVSVIVDRVRYFARGLEYGVASVEVVRMSCLSDNVNFQWDCSLRPPLQKSPGGVVLIVTS